MGKQGKYRIQSRTEANTSRVYGTACGYWCAAWDRATAACVEKLKIEQIYTKLVTRAEINEQDEIVEIPVQSRPGEEGEPILDSTWEAEL